MKQRLQGILIGLLIGVLLSGSVAVAASGEFQVQLGKFRYMFDGVEKKPDVSQGFVQGIEYQGRSYVPLRFVADSLGKNVVYDSSTQTIWLGKKEGAFQYLSDIEYARTDKNNAQFHFNKWDNVGGFSRYSEGFSIAENKYLHGIGLENLFYASNNGTGSIEYNLNGNYKKFTGYIGIDDYSKDSGNPGKIIIYGDDNVLYTSPDMKGGDVPREFEVNLSGVLRLKIEFITSGNDYKSTTLINLVEPKIFQ
jgi:hypothetical protein